MRIIVSVVFAVLLIILGICWAFARRSKRDISNHVAFLISGMSIPLLGNLILTVAGTEVPALIGSYIYYIGMDIAVFSLLHFTYAYCELGKAKRWQKIIVYGLLLFDVTHYALNPFIHLI